MSEMHCVFVSMTKCKETLYICSCNPVLSGVTNIFTQPSESKLSVSNEVV
jgi:hypothetical protein